MVTLSSWEGRVVSIGKLTVALVLVLAASCREPGLQSSMGQLHLEPERVSFGTLYVGQTVEAHLSVRNDGRSRATIEWKELDAPFQVVLLPFEAEPGMNDVVVRVTPLTEGSFHGTLGFDFDGKHQEADLFAAASTSPQCPVTDSCRQSTFNPATGKCEERERQDGSACDMNSVCISGGTCQSGRCVGTPISCDDGNACTVDVCNATNGCEHLPAPPCPGDGACLKGVCDPLSGCGLAPMDDGSACGPVQTCEQAQVCIAGACVMRDPPDGYLCAQASPCQGEGHCAGSACVRAPASELKATWNYDSFANEDADGGFTTEQYHDMVVEPSGAVSLSGFFYSAPRLRANTTESVEAVEGQARRCILWNNRLVCADYPAAVNGKISAINLGTGATVWTFDVRVARPDFVDLTQTLFMARMAVQGSDRLAALFEAYPKSINPQATGNCRNYFLVVLDATGKLVSAQQVFDPVLEVCNHPHPYGFAADSVGNLFISFSQTVGQPAPLVPGNTTTVMSYTRDGVFRWKFTDTNLVGGELAVATGLLYPENSPIAIMASTGQPAYTLAAPFGRLVVTAERSVPAPTVGATTLRGYEAGTPTQRWVHTLPAGESFWSDQIRLAQWSVRGGQRTVALTFTKAGASTWLKAIDTRDGSQAFSCPLRLEGRSAPQLVEVSEGSMSLMEGSDTCGKCDPPFASSSAAFHTFPLPLISPANEPWLGTFGGPTHDHREEVVVTPVPPSGG
ncbi:MAG: tenascin-X [Archangiaceae bacterium]|nr:tenascin-X [Archangiaceae bacterium]